MMNSKYDWIRKAQRCLRMLSELHRLGFQHLRGMPYFNAQGFRFAIAPRYYFSDNGIAISAAKLSDEFVAITGADHFFNRTDTESNDARALAEKFITRFPDIALAGKGCDWVYAGWLLELIGFLKQSDMIPTVWWEGMNGRPEDLLALAVWGEGKDNIDWIGGNLLFLKQILVSLCLANPSRPEVKGVEGSPIGQTPCMRYLKP
ncbi:hypothetical protein [Enterobacter cloacae]|uniref:hypothetical protein n=2 Tax=Enterobacter cloacae TaxID=550 RepID=UPI001F5EE1FD|nr:hypothetical protein [Enterobacter cloacae]